MDVITGHDLKLARVDARVTVRRLAGTMGVTPQRISNIEASSRPTPEAVERYWAALVHLSGRATTGAGSRPRAHGRVSWRGYLMTGQAAILVLAGQEQAGLGSEPSPGGCAERVVAKQPRVPRGLATTGSEDGAG